MIRLELDAPYSAECEPTEGFIPGKVFHVVRYNAGGANLTPIARFFCWRPKFIEGYHAHWRVDCYVHDHALSPEPEWVGRTLASALLEHGVCDEPMWVSWHKSHEQGGNAYGRVFEDD
jgi:hypothetical protein